MRTIPHVLLFTVVLLQTNPGAEAELGEDASIREQIRRLASDSFQERTRATKALVQAGERAIPEVMKAATVKKPEVRLRAFRILKLLAESQEDATSNASQDALRTLKRSKDQNVAEIALNALKELGKLRQDDAVAALKRLGAEIRSGNRVKIDNDWQGGDDGLIYFKSMSGVQSVYIRQRAEVTGAGLSHLKGLKSLRELTVQSNLVADVGMIPIGQLTQLTSLYLGFTKITDRGLPHLERLTNLERLTLPHGVTDAGLKHLKPLKKLRQIDFSNARKVKGPGLVHLVELKDLASVDLYTTSVSGEDLHYLVDLPNLKNLTTSQNNMTDAGMPHIAKLKNLEYLSIGNTYVTDDGVAHLSSLKNLRMLYLNENSLTDACLEHIAGLSNLEALWLKGRV